MKILFVIDPPQKLRFPWDTTSFFAAECQKRKMIVYICTPADLFLKKNNVFGHLTRVKIDPLKGFHPLSKSASIPLTQMDVVWMRKDPPVDGSYHQTCLLLSQVPSSTLVLNNPQTLINKNEKLFPLEFKKWAPRTCVTSSVTQLKHFLRFEKGKMVIKPLSNRGGRGVELINDSNPEKKLLQLTKKEKELIIAQQFLPEALTRGDKRIVIVDGKPLGAFLRPPTAKTLTGKPIPFVKDHPAQLTKREKAICQDLAPALKKHNLFFVGIDVIGGRLTEINITSPAGIPELNKLYGRNHEKIVIDQLCRKIKSAHWRTL